MNAVINGPSSIFMVEEAWDDDYNPRYWLWVTQSDHGFFVTREAAQAKVDALDNLPDRYQKYVDAAKDKHGKLLTNWAKNVRQWDILSYAGEPMETVRPKVPVLKVLEYAEWTYTLEYRTRVVEVKAAV